MIQFARLIRDAIFAPSCFLLLLNRGRRAVVIASFATLAWTSIAVGLTMTAMSAMLPISGRAIAVGVLMAPFLSWTFAGFGMIISGAGEVRTDRLEGDKVRVVANKSVSIGAGLAFWVLRSQITFTPVVAIFAVLVAHENLKGAPLPPVAAAAALAALCVGFGMALATMITVTVSRQRSAPQARRVLAASLAFMALEVATFPASPERRLLLFFLLGCLIGMVRPISWLWQSIASLALAALASRTRRGAVWWRAHPALFDELTLLGLPGLAAFLARLYARDPEVGLLALLTVHQQAGQRRAVRRAIRLLVAREPLAARFLFDLSACPDGVSLLAYLRERLLPVHPLIRPYADFGAVSEPQAWPAVIGEALPLLTPRAGQPGFAALAAVLQASQGILLAHEWQEAAVALAAEGPQDPDNPLWRAYGELRAAALELHDQQSLSSELPAKWTGLAGWPAHLLASVAEQLTYLHQRAAASGSQEVL